LPTYRVEQTAKAERHQYGTDCSFGADAFCSESEYRVMSIQPATAINDRVALKIRSLVAEHLGVDTKRVSDEAQFMKDLGADWLDCLELAIAIEEDFNIEFADDDIERLVAVGDLVRFVETHQQITTK
jgi:acyl carrier protein